MNDDDVQMLKKFNYSVLFVNVGIARIVLVYMRSNDNSSGSEIYYHTCIDVMGMLQ